MILAMTTRAIIKMILIRKRIKKKHKFLTYIMRQTVIPLFFQQFFFCDTFIATQIIGQYDSAGLSGLPAFAFF